ncbi:PUA domain-containing protein [Methanochimaera problematica]|uniref:PUA domain-containing protein n=1 Tax=Methanochimaera problematica TaxID=2609417 RepID=UPI002938E7F5|nr:PUA domain-containing protein [Methanoplanus sp. FWC-SCC4]
MSTESLKNNHLKRIRVIADFQFGKNTGEYLFPDECEFKLSTTKRIRYVLLDGDRVATVRANDGRLTLSNKGASRLYECLKEPGYRVNIKSEVSSFVESGKNAMAKHVVSADENIRAGDEVLVCDESGRLIATGSALLSGEEMTAFNYGVAVQIRKGS